MLKHAEKVKKVQTCTFPTFQLLLFCVVAALSGTLSKTTGGHSGTEEWVDGRDTKTSQDSSQVFFFFYLKVKWNWEALAHIDTETGGWMGGQTGRGGSGGEVDDDDDSVLPGAQTSQERT